MYLRKDMQQHKKLLGHLDAVRQDHVGWLQTGTGMTEKSQRHYVSKIVWKSRVWDIVVGHAEVTLQQYKTRTSYDQCVKINLFLFNRLFFTLYNSSNEWVGVSRPPTAEWVFPPEMMPRLWSALAGDEDKVWRVSEWLVSWVHTAI